jgi:hypothetical protein
MAQTVTHAGHDLDRIRFAAALRVARRTIVQPSVISP